jgi:hypothetical protein
MFKVISSVDDVNLENWAINKYVLCAVGLTQKITQFTSKHIKI